MSALPQPSPESQGYHETPSMILPSAVPAEIGAAVDAASRRAEALASNGRTLHFEVDAEGELVIQMKDRNGWVVKTLSPTQAISLMGGLGQV